MNTHVNGRVWLITGASSGFGRALAEAALAAGDTVVATARRPEDLDGLVAAHPDRAVAVALDVTDHPRGDAVVAEAVRRFGRIDVLVNNAGYGHVGAVEETTDRELRDLMEVHLLGPAALTRAVLPHMRGRRSGAIVQMSSFGGRLSYAGFGAYSAAKSALEGLSEALAREVAAFGITVLIVEPGAFRTGFFGRSLHQAAAMPAYEDTVGATRERAAGFDGKQPGDPARAAAAILTALDAEHRPLRLALGGDAIDALHAHAARAREELCAWEAVGRDTAFIE